MSLLLSRGHRRAATNPPTSSDPLGSRDADSVVAVFVEAGSLTDRDGRA
jgi:hypothetical protein